MFGVGMPELAVILVVALLVLGPKRLPEMARALGKGLAEFRKVTGDVNKELQGARDLIEREAREHERLSRELEREKRLAKTRDPEAPPATEPATADDAPAAGVPTRDAAPASGTATGDAAPASGTATGDAAPAEADVAQAAAEPASSTPVAGASSSSGPSRPES